MKIVCSKCSAHIEAGATPPPVLVCHSCGQQNPLRPGAQMPKGMSGCLIAVILGAASVPVIGILAAIAIPNYIKFQARAKQAECKANLKSIYLAEKAYFEKKDLYSTRLQELGIDIERGNRYAYFVGPGAMQLRDGAALATSELDEAVGVDVAAHLAASTPGLDAVTAPASVGLVGTCPDCAVTAACVGNIDNDPDLDVWTISTEVRTAADGHLIASGVPFNASPDL